MKTKDVIIGVTHHSVSDVEQLLTSYFPIHPFVRWNGKKTKKQVGKKLLQNSHLLFSRPQSLGYAFSKDVVAKTPFVWGSLSVLSQIALTENLYCLDAELNSDGIIKFKDVNMQELEQALTADWTKHCSQFSLLDSVREENGVVLRSGGVGGKGSVAEADEDNKSCQSKRYGTVSNLQLVINSILATIPEFCHLPFMVAFTKGTGDGFKSFDIFCKENRIVSKENKASFKELDTVLFSIMTPLQLLVKGRKKKFLATVKELDSSSYLSMKTIKKYRDTYLEYNLSDFLDNEDNINIAELVNRDVELG